MKRMAATNSARPNLRLVTSTPTSDPDTDNLVQQARRHSAWAPTITPGYSEGALLAIEMLDDFRESDCVVDECNIDPQWHPGKPQRDIVAEYLPRLKDKAEVTRGFTSLLSYALARGLYDVCPRSEWLELLTRMSAADAYIEWDRLRHEGQV